jgi:predicted HAD superfamily Cof-like phosphohydrolase
MEEGMMRLLHTDRLDYLHRLVNEVDDATTEEFDSYDPEELNHRVAVALAKLLHIRATADSLASEVASTFKVVQEG